MQPLQRREGVVPKEGALPSKKGKESSEIVQPTIAELPKESGISKPGDINKNIQKVASQKLPSVLNAVVKAAKNNKESLIINIKMAMPEVKGNKTHSFDAMIKVAAALFQRAHKAS